MYNRICSYNVVREVYRKVLSRSEIPCVLNANVAHRLYYAPCCELQIRTLRLHNFHKLKYPQICCRTHVPIVSFSSETDVSKIKLHNDPNQFGNLSKDSPVEMIQDEDDAVEDTYITYPVPRKQQLRIKQYADIIKQHLENKDFGAAMEVLETRMIIEDRVKPDSYIFSLLISACGRFGHTNKAFKLYNQMKKRNLKIPGAVYTALFNACANAFSPEDGLKRTLKLQTLLAEKGVELNAHHYHAMMKAFGRCGDLSRAFQTVDVMIDKQLPINGETFNFLLQACISKKEDGFRYALLVWHKMLQRNVEPTYHSFNLLIRAVRDCNMGELLDVERTIQQLTGESKHETSAKIEEQLSTAVGSETTSEMSPLQENFLSPGECLPDLLSAEPTLTCDISSLDLKKPHERLLLLGGSIKFLEHMKKSGFTPDIKTYTLLLDCIAPSISAEKNLLSQMKKNHIRIDIEFCNMLIKKRSFRFDYQNAQDVLGLIYSEKLEPDIVTFGVLALACTNEDEARELICNMRQTGYRINVEIIGAMLKQGCIQHNFKYVTKILYIAKEENIKPSPLFMENINTLIASSRAILKTESQVSLQRKGFRKEFTTFMYKYQAWLNEINDKENKTNFKYH